MSRPERASHSAVDAQLLVRAHLRIGRADTCRARAPVHLLIGHDPDPTGQWTPSADALVPSSPNITMAFARRSIDDEWLEFAADAASWLGLRAGSCSPSTPVRRSCESGPAIAYRTSIRRLADFESLGHQLLRPLLKAGLRTAERVVPPAPELKDAIVSYRPDVTLVTPLIDLGSYQHDVVRVSRSLGIPTGVCIGSWDHLSSKALIRDQPDEVFVWNETQKREAVTMHGVRPERVTVTGAQCFDHWFDRQPALNGDDFAREGRPRSLAPIRRVCVFRVVRGKPERSAIRARVDCRASRQRA
jgi:hypothetical protein